MCHEAMLHIFDFNIIIINIIFNLYACCIIIAYTKRRVTQIQCLMLFVNYL